MNVNELPKTQTPEEFDLNEASALKLVADYLKGAFTVLNSSLISNSREKSLTVTKIEEASMWLNKDRTIKGLLTTTPTHLENKVKP